MSAVARYAVEQTLISISTDAVKRRSRRQFLLSEGLSTTNSQQFGERTHTVLTLEMISPMQCSNRYLVSDNEHRSSNDNGSTSSYCANSKIIGISSSNVNIQQHTILQQCEI